MYRYYTHTCNSPLPPEITTYMKLHMYHTTNYMYICMYVHIHTTYMCTVPQYNNAGYFFIILKANTDTAAKAEATTTEPKIVFVSKVSSL